MPESQGHGRLVLTKDSISVRTAELTEQRVQALTVELAELRTEAQDPGLRPAEQAELEQRIDLAREALEKAEFQLHGSRRELTVAPVTQVRLPSI